MAGLPRGRNKRRPAIAGLEIAGMMHPGYLESGNGWPAQGKKQALDLRGQLHILEKVITLLLNGFGERLPLLHIPLDYINNKREAEHRGEIVEDAKPRIDNTRRVIIVEQDTDDDKAVADLVSQKNSTHGKREDVQVNERNRHNEVVGIRDRANGPQDQCKGQPRRSI